MVCLDMSACSSTHKIMQYGAHFRAKMQDVLCLQLVVGSSWMTLKQSSGMGGMQWIIVLVL